MNPFKKVTTFWTMRLNEDQRAMCRATMSFSTLAIMLAFALFVMPRL